MRSNPEERDSLEAYRARGTADDKRDSHPRWCSFPRGLHLRLHWLRISRLQFKAKGPDFNAELIPVHSPLLRESYLVSFPPLTYMLKFSGFAHLTSCLGKGRNDQRGQGQCHNCNNKRHQRRLASCASQTNPHTLNASEAKHPNTQRRTSAQSTRSRIRHWH